MSLCRAGYSPIWRALQGSNMSYGVKKSVLTLGLPQIRITVNNETLGEKLMNLKEWLLNPPLPSLWDNESILRAVPKKKPSYGKTRAKLYAPGNKKIQPLNNLVRCPACGSVKRSHFMCMNCFAEIKQFLKSMKKSKNPPVEKPQSDLNEIDEKIVYPGKRMSEYERRLNKKDWIPVREAPLPYDKNQIKYKK